MKKIFLSLSMMGLVASIAAIGSTGAFFTDTQTSAANVFTAGSIHLLIDHTLSTYNGSGDEVIVTDPSWTFVSDNASSPPPSGNAVNLTFVHPAWETIGTAHWIWATDGPTDPAGPNDQAYTFTKTFNWTGPISSASLQFGADNYYDVYVNGTLIGSNHSLITDNFQNPHTTDVTADIVQGINTIKFIGENQHVDGSNATSNPAGIDLELDIHGQQTFGPTDLTNQTFWNFSDVKPQDQGRDVMSLHDPANDAWTCLIVDNIDNTIGTGGGPLGPYLHVFFWHDLNHDGNFDPGSGETPVAGPSNATNIANSIFNFSGAPFTIPIHDSTTGNGPMLSGSEDDLGAAWCAGNFNPVIDPVTGAITCDGSSVPNSAQDASVTADLNFYATQARNQPNFTCSSVVLP